MILHFPQPFQFFFLNKLSLFRKSFNLNLLMIQTNIPLLSKFPKTNHLQQIPKRQFFFLLQKPINLNKSLNHFIQKNKKIQTNINFKLIPKIMRDHPRPHNLKKLSSLLSIPISKFFKTDKFPLNNPKIPKIPQRFITKINTLIKILQKTLMIIKKVKIPKTHFINLIIIFDSSRHFPKTGQKFRQNRKIRIC